MGGVGVERWAVRGREGGVHKGAPSNTQQHYGNCYRTRRWVCVCVWGGGGGGGGGGMRGEGKTLGGRGEDEGVRGKRCSIQGT